MLLRVSHANEDNGQKSTTYLPISWPQCTLFVPSIALADSLAIVLQCLLTHFSFSSYREKIQEVIVVIHTDPYHVDVKMLWAAVPFMSPSSFDRVILPQITECGAVLRLVAHFDATIIHLVISQPLCRVAKTTQ